jgi:serine/threonine-protein kinase RsbT
MNTLSKVTLPINAEKDVVLARQHVRDFAAQLGMGTVDQTKLMTATSELARNILLYAGTGEVTIGRVKEGIRKGIKVIFKDAGPGIPNINKAMQDGYSTGKSLGIGLPGAKRLVNHFDILSKVGHGTTITIICWGR